MTFEPPEENIRAVRHFNRFFTRQIGVLREGLVHSPYPLTDARILFELGQSDQVTAARLARELGLDAGYLSRILARLDQQGLLEKVRSENDGRQLLLSLTTAGKEAFELLDRRSREEVSEMLDDLSEEDQKRLLNAMQIIESVLSKGFKFSEPFVLRPHEPGDMGWIVQRHSILYAQEYGWDEHFEAFVAQSVANFINHANSTQERCWIAEMNGEIIGSVFVMQQSETVAKLQFLLVEPKARGQGLGTRLVKECLRFARRRRYQKIVIWINRAQREARHIVENIGFHLAAEETHYRFGQDFIGETWELTL